MTADKPADKPAPKRTTKRATKPKTAVPVIADPVDTADPVAIDLAQTASSSRAVTAGAIDIERGGIGRADAHDIAVSMGGIGMARGDRVSVEMGGIGAIVGAGEARLTQGVVGFAAANTVTIDQSLVRTVIGKDVTVRQPSGILVLIAARVEGTVRPVLDWRGALALGAAFGLVVGLIRRGRG